MLGLENVLGNLVLLLSQIPEELHAIDKDLSENSRVDGNNRQFENSRPEFDLGLSHRLIELLLWTSSSEPDTLPDSF